MAHTLGKGPDKFIEIIVAPDGSTTIEANNFAGQGCLAATKPYEDVLGVAGERTEKPEIRRLDVVNRPGRTVGPDT